MEQMGALAHAHDLHIATLHDSAFRSTPLLQMLRSRFITKLYVYITGANEAVYATMADAARHGISIILVHDCLEHCKQDKCDVEMQTIKDILGADVQTSHEVLNALKYDGYDT